MMGVHNALSRISPSRARDSRVAVPERPNKFLPMLRDVSWRYFDFWLLGAVVLATAFGTTMIRSAVAGNEVLLPLIDRQIYFAVAGLVLIALYLSASEVFGAARWFSVGVLFLQPTEFAKIAAILLLARYFEKTQNHPRDLRW